MQPPDRPDSPDRSGSGDGPSEPASIDLARAAREGADDALALLIERHQAQVQAIVRRRLGRELRRFHESGDIVQEAFVQAVRTFDRYDLPDEDAFLRWISGVVENRLRDLSKFHRAERRGSGAERRLASIDLGEGGGGFDAPGDEAGPATRAQSGDRDERVRAALDELDERTRRLIEARLDERPWAEVARELDFPSEGAARMAYSRALVGLSRRLKAQDDGAEP